MAEFVERNLLYMVSCMDIFAVSLIVPLFNQHLQSIGYSNVNIGLLSSVYSAVQFSSSPIIGHLSDVYGSKRVLVATLLACSLCYPFMGIVTSFASLLIIRSAIGFSKHTQLLCKNYIQETLTNEKTHFNSFGKLNGFTSMGFVIGPLIGGYVVSSRNGFVYMCVATGALFMANAAFAYFLPTAAFAQQPRKNVTAARNRTFVSSFKTIPWSVCWDLFALKLLVVFAVFSFYINYNLSISKRFRVSPVVVGYSLSLQGFVRSITGFAIDRVFAVFPNSWSVSSKMLAGYALLTVTFLGLYACDSFYVFLACLIPLNVCVCFIRIINHEALVERTKTYNRGIILGAFDNVTAVCRFALPLVSGYMVDKFGYDSVYVVIIVLLSVGIATIARARGRNDGTLAEKIRID